MRGLQRTISITLLWDPVLGYDNSGCTGYTYNDTASVADFKVVRAVLNNLTFSRLKKAYMNNETRGMFRTFYLNITYTGK